MASNLFKALKVKGGTLYTFHTATDQMSYLFDASSIEMAFSKFAVIRLPKWANTADDSMYLNPTLIGNPATVEPNTVFPKVLQNYVENMLSYSDIERNDNSLSTFAEPAFWKGLEKVGALSRITAESVVISGNTRNKLKEPVETSDYKKSVRYLGDMSLLNHVRSGGSEYLEVFAVIPTSAGKMEDVRWSPSGTVVHNFGQIPDAGGDIETLGLDSYSGTDNVTAIYDTIDRKYEVSGDEFEGVIDWESAPLADGGDYEFNAVLFYYDIWDSNNKEETTRTNLYGILILEDFDVLSGGAYSLPTLKKIMPSGNSTGNSFAFRLNLKWTGNPNQVTSEVTVNDNAGIGMELYMAALARLQKVSDAYGDLEKKFLTFQTQFSSLLDSQSKSAELTEAVGVLQGLDRRVQILETGNSGENYIRVTNEEIFTLFTRLVQLTQNPLEQPIQLLVSSRAYLPQLIDRNLYIFEDQNGNRWQWNFSTTSWDWVQ